MPRANTVQMPPATIKETEQQETPAAVEQAAATENAADEAPLTPAAQKVLTAYEKATTAETLQELTEIITLCADARKEKLSQKLTTSR